MSTSGACCNCGMNYQSCACYITYAPYNNWTEDMLLNRIDCERILHANILKFKPKFVRILAMRYGLFGEIPRTLKQIGYECGVTGNRIRQILFNTFEILKQLIKNNDVKSEYLLKLKGDQNVKRKCSSGGRKEHAST